MCYLPYSFSADGWWLITEKRNATPYASSASYRTTLLIELNGQTAALANYSHSSH